MNIKRFTGIGARFVMIATVTSLAVAGQSAAGPIILENNAGPNVCEVEVTVGPDAPKGPVQKFGGLDGMWRQNFDTSKLCYRVSNPPETCTGSWTDWRCCDALSGESLCVIE